MEKFPVKNFFAQDGVKKKFDELLGKRSSAFITSVLQIVSSNSMLQNADPVSIYNAACLAATLDLPISNQLGFAYIVPYGKQAQFQLGYRGYIQLAQRSGQYQTIGAAAIHQGQLVRQNPLTGFEFDFEKPNDGPVVGYAAYFRLLNGFEKTLYMSLDDMKKHGLRFSQTYKRNSGLWVDDFDAMAIKTVLKLLLSKYGPLSIEMQMATISDQAVVNNADTLDVSYVDNSVAETNPVHIRALALIRTTKTEEQLQVIVDSLDESLISDIEIVSAIESQKQSFNSK